MSRTNEFHILQGRTAGFVTRLFAYGIDLVIVVGIVVLGGWLAALIDGVMLQMSLETRVSVATLYTFLVPGIIGAYFVMFWSLTGRTIGKWFMGLKVIGVNGQPPTVWRSIIRMVGYGFSAIVFWVGYLWVFIDDERQGWHDHMAKTWVVYDYERRKGGEVYASFLRRGSTAQETDN